MSDERIDIEVVDKISAEPAKKLRDIAKAAREGGTAVQKLKAELSSINDGPVQRLKVALDGVSKSIKDQMNAQKALTAATNASTAADLKAETAKARLSAETAKAALAEARLTTETTKTQIAVAKAAQAQSQAAAAALRLEAATQRASQRMTEEETAARNLAAQVAALKASVDPLGAAQDRLNAELAQAKSLYDAGAISASAYAHAEQVLKERLNDVTTAQNQVNQAVRSGATHSKAMTQAGLNLSRQFADIGVTAAMGMNPLMIIIQQGPQIIDIFQQLKSQGIGVSQALKMMWAGFAPLLPIILAVAAVIGIVAAGFGLLHRELSKGYPKDMTEGMKLTEEQLERVKNKTVTFGDTFQAVFNVIGKRIMDGPIGDALDWLGDRFNNVMDNIVDATTNGFDAIVGHNIATVKTISKYWNQLPLVVAAVAMNTANMVIGAFEYMINAAVGSLNEVIKVANDIPGVELPMFNKVTLGRFKAAKGTMLAEIQDFHSEQTKLGAQASKDARNRLGKDISDEAQAIRRRKILEEAGKPNKGPKGSKDNGEKGFDRAAELKNVNRELDNELTRMGMLKDAREVQQRLDQISQKFAEKNKDLTKEETAALRAKIVAVQEAGRVQAQMDRIYDAAHRPLQIYNDTLAGSKKLLDDGAISQARFNYETEQAKLALDGSKDLIGANSALRAYEDTLSKARLSLDENAISQKQFNEATAKAAFEYAHANDALLSYNEALNDELVIAKLYGPALERMNYMQQVQNSLVAQGKTLYDASTGALTAEAAALMKKYEELQKQKQIQSELNAIYTDVTANDTFIVNMTDMYSEIERMRQADILSTEQAERAKRLLQLKYEEMRLANTRTFFGNLATLSSHGNKKLAAIGKAAAMVQATIDGYLAVQKALASAPPPLNYVFAAGAAVAAAVQVAGIASTNVGSFKDGGDFTVNGQDGVDKNLISMNVSKGERVRIETPSQQRANDAEGGSGAGMSVKIVNISDKSEMIAAMSSEDGERVIINVIRENPQLVNGILQGGG